MSLLNRFVSHSEFESYEDFAAGLRIDVPPDFNFAYDVVDVYADEQPDRTAIVWCNEGGVRRDITFSDLKRESCQAANVFRSLGIRKGDHVLLILKKEPAFWSCLLGLHRLGAIATPATHMLTANDIEHRFKSASIHMVVCVGSEALLEHAEEADRRCGGMLAAKAVVNGKRNGWLDLGAEVEKASAEFPRPTGEDAVNLHDISLVYFSSGTTGYPKMVQHDFAYPLAHIITAKYWQNVIDGGLHFTVADTGWAKSAWGKIYGQWICGSAVFVYDYETFNAAGLLDVASRYGVTTFCAPPTLYRMLIKEDLSHYDLSSLRHCVVAGEPLNAEVYERFLAQTGLKLMEGYGQTETIVAIATFPWMEPKPGSMGRPTPGYRIELLNAEGRACEIGEEGEIVIDTSDGAPVGVFAGYYRSQETTDSVWYGGYYHTGDLAWMDEDGYFWFVGRSDDVIKSSGYRIGPFEVESALMQHPAVLECAITGVPDPLRGQAVKATIILAKGYTASEELKVEIQNHVKKVTAPYKYPRVVEFAAQLPKTISGKIRRVEIRDHDKQGTEESQA